MIPAIRVGVALFVVGAASCGGGGSSTGKPDGGGADAPVTPPVDAAGEAGDVAVPPAHQRLCDAYCDRLGKLRCQVPAPDCKADCTVRMGFAPWCEPAGLAAFTCLRNEPDPSFTCESDGPRAKPGVCAAERAAFEDCLFEGPLPDMTSACTAYSALMTNAAATLQCGTALSKDQCLQAVADSLPCNGALGIFIHCLATKQPPSAFECSEGVVIPRPDSPCVSAAIPLVLCTQ